MRNASRFGMSRGLSNIVAVVVLIVMIVALSLFLYMSYSQRFRVPEIRKEIGLMRVEGVRAGIGFVDLFVKSLDVETDVDMLYLVECDSMKVYTAVKLPSKIHVVPGRTVLIHAPLIGLGIDLESLPSEACVALGTRKGITLVSSSPIPFAYYLRLAAEKATIGLVAARDVSCTVGDLNVDPSQVHWIYLNLVTGRYRFEYVSGTDVRYLEGRATFIFENSTLDLSRMSWDQRYGLGPVVIFVNPYFATQNYSIHVIDIHGNDHSFTLEKLVDSVEQVSMDIVALWEDLWWPNTSSDLDNYVDHVVRLTVFVNNTARIEVISASGCYLHMFMLSPPSFEEVEKIVEEYQENGHRLDAESGVVYVKSHGAAIPPLDPYDIWDPVNGEWVSKWPPVFYR